MARSRQREEAPPSHAFSGEMSLQRAGGTALLIFSRRGRHPAAVSDSGCPTDAAFSKPARLYSFPRAIGPTDETPPETSQPPYGKACSPPSGAPDESPKQKGRSLYGSVPCSFISCFPSPRFQPDETHWEKDEKRKEGPFPASGKDGSPQKYISYDVGGTMESPYIFQVSGR